MFVISKGRLHREETSVSVCRAANTKDMTGRLERREEQWLQILPLVVVCLKVTIPK